MSAFYHAEFGDREVATPGGCAATAKFALRLEAFGVAGRTFVHGGQHFADALGNAVANLASLGSRDAVSAIVPPRAETSFAGGRRWYVTKRVWVRASLPLLRCRVAAPRVLAGPNQFPGAPGASGGRPGSGWDHAPGPDRRRRLPRSGGAHPADADRRLARAPELGPSRIELRPVEKVRG